MTRRSSVALAHLRHPDRQEKTLCGAEPTRVVGCPDCASRREIMLRVHVQSPRKPDRSFCGMPIRVPSGDPPLAYVSAAVASRLLGGGHGAVPICLGCRDNLARYDVAAARRRSSGPRAGSNGERRRTLPVPDAPQAVAVRPDLGLAGPAEAGEDDVA